MTAHDEKTAEAWLKTGLKAAGLKAQDLHTLKGSDPRKLMLADHLWRRTVVSQEWIAEKLAMMHQEGTHTFPGTAARYVTYNQQDPDEITILLVWRQANQSAPIQRHEALTALMVDFAEVLDWDTAQVQEHHGLLHA